MEKKKQIIIMNPKFASSLMMPVRNLLTVRLKNAFLPFSSLRPEAASKLLTDIEPVNGAGGWGQNTKLYT